MEEENRPKLFKSYMQAFGKDDGRRGVLIEVPPERATQWHTPLAIMRRMDRLGLRIVDNLDR